MLTPTLTPTLVLGGLARDTATEMLRGSGEELAAGSDGRGEKLAEHSNGSGGHTPPHQPGAHLATGPPHPRARTHSPALQHARTHTTLGHGGPGGHGGTEL